jgi:hypothetical protein
MTRTPPPAPAGHVRRQRRGGRGALLLGGARGGFRAASHVHGRREGRGMGRQDDLPPLHLQVGCAWVLYTVCRCSAQGVLAVHDMWRRMCACVCMYALTHVCVCVCVCACVRVLSRGLMDSGHWQRGDDDAAACSLETDLPMTACLAAKTTPHVSSVSSSNQSQAHNLRPATTPHPPKPQRLLQPGDAGVTRRRRPQPLGDCGGQHAPFLCARSCRRAQHRHAHVHAHSRTHMRTHTHTHRHTDTHTHMQAYTHTSCTHTHALFLAQPMHPADAPLHSPRSRGL